MSAASRRCFVHVGLPKTGTSYLQSILLRNTEELARQGLAVLPAPAGLKPSTQLMLALRDRLIAGHDPDARDVLLARFRDQAALSPGDVLLTQEQLAPATPEQVAELFDLVSDREVHVVVTSRSLARQVPSGWQERVKTRSVHSYRSFLEAVIARNETAADFWRHQDLPDVLDRWGSSLPPERVHVVTVPPASTGPDVLLERYCSVLGIDASRLANGTSRANESLGIVQVELLRRINEALGDRLPSPRRGYATTAKWFFANRVLKQQESPTPRLPRWAEQWCRDTTDSWIATIDERGYDVVGDVQDLLPADPHFGDDDATDVPEPEITRSAVEALAALLTLHAEERTRIEALRARVRAQEAELARLRRRPSRLRGLAGRARAALR